MKLKKFAEFITKHITYITLVILLFQVGILGFQAYETFNHDQKVSEHDKILTRPILDFEYEEDIDKPELGIWVDNTGLGPAIIKQTRVYLDGRRINNYDNIYSRIGFKQSIVRYGELKEGNSIGSNTTKIELFSLSTKNRTEAQLNRFIKFIDERLVVKIDYDSIDGEHFTKCSPYGPCPNNLKE